MRWEHTEEYTVGVTVVNEDLCHVACVAVENEETPVSPITSFLLCVPIKHLFKPGNTDVIVASTSWC
jgi:hypothetical protein